MMHRPGISNRESAENEAQERRQHPAQDTGSPLPEDAAGRRGEQPLIDLRNRQTVHKAGSRSIAQKEAESRYPDRPATGTYGLVSYVVKQSTHEIGIRVALGASGRSIVCGFVGRGLRRDAIGAGLGMAVALAMTRLLGTALVGVSATDAAFSSAPSRSCSAAPSSRASCPPAAPHVQIR
jgi:hypothetical protein